MEKLLYLPHMLPGINYGNLSSDGLKDRLLDLEYETQVILKNLSNDIKDIIVRAKISTVLEIMVAHLGAYLGFMSVAALGDEQAKKLMNKIMKLVTAEVEISYKIFKQHPITRAVGNNEIRRANLEKLREKAPGSIIVQTLRLGRVIFDILDELRTNRSYIRLKDNEQFAPTMPFMLLLRNTCNFVLKDLEKYNGAEAKLYHINHVAVQIGWLIGYFSDMSGEERIELFLNYTRGTIETYIDFGERFLEIPMNKMKNMAKTELGSLSF